MKATESREELIGSRNQLSRSEDSLQAAVVEKSLTATEKKFLLTAERGDCAGVKRLIQEFKDKPEELDINCVDPLNRSALIAAIENENIELIRILLESNIRVKDSLLHAIKEEYVEAVEILLEWEEKIHLPGQPYSWEAVDRSSSNFTPDITPLILAAHMNNYEILKILLDRGASLPMPHDVRCGCDECVASSEADSLRHSQARINAYRALSASSLIALSSRDPLLTAFELSWELRRLSRMENEFRDEYNEMRANCQEFATSLLDHARTSFELEVMLNHNPQGDPWTPGERQSLERLKLAIKYKQKKFVAHPNVQQLLAAIWYEGLPGFRRKNMLNQLMEVAKLGSMFPVYSTIYMIAPTSKIGLFVKKPFVKFISHSSSYAFFLTLLGLASQRVEFLLIEWFGTPWMKDILHEWQRKERGSLPGPVEFAIILYVFSLIWNEIRSLYADGLLEYVNDLWNVVDFISNIFYLMWISLRFTSCYIVQREYRRGIDPWYPRERWDPFDPMLLSEGAFAAGMIFSFLKLVHIFSVNPHLGPLQISLGRMIIDIMKFFFIYSLVLFAFGCGMNQLLWYYADLEKHKCYHLPGGYADWDKEERACNIWRRFANLFEASQSLFWASFGLVDLSNFELTGIKSFTRFWAMLMFGSYSVINIIVLLNMLIAMMSNSYQIISERADTEWKFARSRLWMSYFEEGDTVPPPFNLLPSTKLFMKLLCCGSKGKNTEMPIVKSKHMAQERHETVMYQLVRRYVTAEQRKRDDFGITEDDVIEIRQDISSMRYELIDILRTNGMKTPSIDPQEGTLANKKGRVMERRLLKDFQIGFVEGLVKEALSSDKGPRDVFSKIARAIGRRASGKSQKKDWNALVRRSTVVRDPIGSTTEARERRQSRQSLRRYILENQSQQLDPEKLVQYNPKLSEVTPAARVAYAKFKIHKIQQEYDERGDTVSMTSQKEQSGDNVNSVVVTSPPNGIPTDQQGDDEVFEADKKSSGSISRPRPRSSLKSTPFGMIPPPSPSPSPPLLPSEPINVTAEVLHEPVKKDFRARTPIEEDPREYQIGTPRSISPSPSKSIPSSTPQKQEPTKSLTPSPSKPIHSGSLQRKDTEKSLSPSKGHPSPSSSPQKKETTTTLTPTPSKPSSSGSPQNKDTEKTLSPPKGQPSSSASPEKKETAKTLAPSSSKRDQSPPRRSPMKPGGKSKITGETLTGWL